jgi:uncharacterized membrane protein YphA (DoxX/SURF4 family)
VSAVATVLSLLIALVFVLAGMARLQGLAPAESVRARLGLAPGLWRAVGAAELLAAAGLILGTFAAPLLALAALAGLLVLMAGAVVAHVRAGDVPRGVVPPVALGLALVVDVWLVARFLA